jgi:hypothetical protein
MNFFDRNGSRNFGNLIQKKRNGPPAIPILEDDKGNILFGAGSDHSYLLRDDSFSRRFCEASSIVLLHIDKQDCQARGWRFDRFEFEDTQEFFQHMPLLSGRVAHAQSFRLQARSGRNILINGIKVKLGKDKFKLAPT